MEALPSAEAISDASEICTLNNTPHIQYQQYSTRHGYVNHTSVRVWSCKLSMYVLILTMMFYILCGGVRRGEGR